MSTEVTARNTPIKYHGASCKTCRRRSRKCTRELPFCQSCTNKGVQCEGYALKWAGMASRGALAGRTGVGKIEFKKSSASKSTDKPKRRQQDQSRVPKYPSSTNSTTTDTSHSAVHGEKVNQEVNVDVSTSAQDDRIEEGVEEEADQEADQQVSMTTQAASQESLFAVDTSSFEWPSLSESQITELLQEFDQPLDISVPELPSLDPAFNNLETAFCDDDAQGTLVIPWNSLNPFQIPPELSFILEYHFYEAASKLCVDNETTSNPYRDYIYPLALQRPALLYACAALSSVHYSTRKQNDSFRVEALRYRGKALSRLQESLWCLENSMDESNLATLLMLILCDMCLGGHTNFETYFTLAKGLINLRGSKKTPGSFVEQYLFWMDIMSCASTARQPAITAADVAFNQEGRIDWSHDVIPCATGLFQVFLDIVALQKWNHASASDLELQHEALKTRVLTCPPLVERGMPWFHLTEAYRYGILLYMALRDNKTQDREEITWLVSSIVKHTKSIPSWSGWSDQLLWPLFHAGLQMSDSKQQSWLRDKFSEMKVSGGFRNVDSAQEVLEKCWAGQVSMTYAELLVSEGVGDLIVI